jgi:hypothetical protein
MKYYNLAFKLSIFVVIAVVMTLSGPLLIELGKWARVGDISYASFSRMLSHIDYSSQNLTHQATRAVSSLLVSLPISLGVWALFRRKNFHASQNTTAL